MDVINRDYYTIILIVQTLFLSMFISIIYRKMMFELRCIRFLTGSLNKDIIDNH